MLIHFQLFIAFAYFELRIRNADVTTIDGRWFPLYLSVTNKNTVIEATGKAFILY